MFWTRITLGVIICLLLDTPNRKEGDYTLTTMILVYGGFAAVLAYGMEV